jgi:AraC family transcriptional regulator
MTVLYARSTGPYGESVAAAWDTLGRWLEGQGLRSRVKLGYGLFRDDPTRTASDLLRYDACVPVMPGVDAAVCAAIGRQTLRGGAYAVHTHVGAYANSGESFSRLHREVVPKRGLAVDYDRPFMAIYLNDPALTREVHRRTDLCVPVLPIRMPVSSNDDGELDDLAEALKDGTAS